MWLTTPRFLAGLAVLILLSAVIAWLEVTGGVSHDHAHMAYGGAALIAILAIATHAKPRMRGWRARNLPR